ncbi:MAG: hypothetical protein M3381_08810 [Actinomycetota bacterium]|nr:hypothetical protein [Actinomycetota bacterium]
MSAATSTSFPAVEESGDLETGDPLVFPVGHYMGPFHPSRNGPAKHHIVRVGWETPKLPDEEHVDIWALAHGLPNRIDTVRWTRQAIIDAANDAEMPDAAGILDSLAGLGLIAEVTPGTEQAREFADSYRLQSLLIGLGNSPDDPVLDGIGLVGIEPIVKVRPRVFEIWQWAHLWPTVWAACEGLAYVAGQVEGSNPDSADPEKVLDLMFDAMRTLISRNAAYLDVTISPPAASQSAR